MWGRSLPSRGGPQTSLPTAASSGFSPLRRATRARRTAVLFAGPVLWLMALLVLAAVIRRTSAAEYALLILAVAFVVAVVWLLWMRAERVRAEREP